MPENQPSFNAVQEFLYRNSNRNGRQKEKSIHKKERDQNRWTMFMARHETAIEFPFFNISDA